MKSKHTDLWPPRQGSWEEAVDPFDVQLSRFLSQVEQAQKLCPRLAQAIDRAGKHKIPASV